MTLAQFQVDLFPCPVMSIPLMLPDRIHLLLILCYQSKFSLFLEFSSSFSLLNCILTCAKAILLEEQQ